MPTCDVDQLARHLGDWGRIGAAMPPVFEAHGERIPMRGPGGEWIGHVLPGLGLQVDIDLAHVGITRPIPHVFERSVVARGIDAMRSFLARLAAHEGGAITTYDGILSAISNGKVDDVPFLKSSFTSVATSWFSTYRAGGLPTAGSYSNIPTGAVHTRLSAGALSAGLTDPSGGDTSYLLSFGFGSSSNLNMLMVCDLLVAAGNISANSSSPQTVSSAALTRYTTGAGVMATLEVTTALGATPANVAISYTNQGNTSGQTSTSTAMTPSAIAQRLQPSSLVPWIPLAAGDTGVRAVASLTLSAAMGSGVLALNLVKPLLMLPAVASNVFVMPSLASQIGLFNTLPTDGTNLGCLVAFVMPTSATTGDIGGMMRVVRG